LRAAGDGKPIYVIRIPEPHKDLNDWTIAGASTKQIATACELAMPYVAQHTPGGIPEPAQPIVPDADDPHPAILHPSGGVLISEFAQKLGTILKDHGFFRYRGRVVQVRDEIIKARSGKEYQVKKLVDLTPATFSTLIEDHCRPLKKTKSGKYIPATISLDIANRTLVCLDLLSQLPVLTLWTNVRLPLRVGAKIVLSPVGYDPFSGVYTSPDAPLVDEQMTVHQATHRWRLLLSEFCFPKAGKTEGKDADIRERERSIAVLLAAALTPFCINLLPEQAKRPAFAATANSEGA
jgi:hypothetical protein